MSQRPHDPANRFTLLCLRGRFDPAALEDARALAAGLDWDAWLAAAQAEALQPLMYRVLRRREIAPAAVEERLRAAHRRNAVRNALTYRELGVALRQLGEEGVQVILLKGAALAQTVYGDIAVRPMVDLDLLVHPGDMPVALRVLARAGYATTEPEARAGLALTYENELLLRKPGSLPIPLELHWSLLDSPHHQHSVSMEWFWQTAREPHPLPPLLTGEGARVLGPEAQTLHLCAHLALHHRGQGLLWLHDVAEVLHFYRDQLNWDLLLSKAVEYDLLLPLQEILPSVVEGWGAPVPAAILERLGRLEPSAEEVRVFRWLTANERPVAQRFWADLASMPGWRQRWRYGAGNLFPSPQYMRQRYDVRQDFLLPLYYPYRWLVGLLSATRMLSKRKSGMT